ncbi:Macrolide export protein MacA [Pseudodesulfovibrio hydrargyri]|uniref:Macrolide export protein MacA n=1 Tax=Pseudodesulfovibrio hydrargyri TaxID=2125990 RepID=A0A1J5NCC3_9BACT|nr:efflux RND transporter periplasmic adaptor subunit [Pseudodesulfovibrio hydrargyri]OIQ49385.1 Macrolide export protein MacA [Pseudodesulfovibrio hydrargyri]
MRKVVIIILALVLLGGGGYLGYRAFCPECADTGALVLYGNVDIRQVNLAFRDSERIRDVLVEEGDVVEGGQKLAQLKTQRLEAQIKSVQAGVDAQKYMVIQLENGSRPEEIRQARAEERQALAERDLTKRTYDRQSRLLKSGANAQQDLDDALAQYDVAKARYQVAVQNRILMEKGARWEEIASAKASLNRLEADLDVLNVQLAESALYAPTKAVVRSRNLEPGDMASPQSPVFTLGVMDPKWVRTYVPETELGRIKPGMRGFAVADSWPDRRFAGWVGFISSTAEFTPRSVETPELRTSLVYEVRLNVHDPDNELRLGMPVTVHFEPTAEPAMRGGAGD